MKMEKKNFCILLDCKLCILSNFPGILCGFAFESSESFMVVALLDVTGRWKEKSPKSGSRKLS